MQDYKLSYSSASLLKGCEAKFYYYKTKTPKDSDFVEDNDALIIGSSFHYILETTKHTDAKGLYDLLKHCVVNFKLKEENTALVAAMVKKYLRLHKKIGLECVGCEWEIKSAKVSGFVDAVMKDENGNWWIVDLKTAARFSPSILSRLKTDVQLNLYSYFYKTIAEEYKLDPSKFMGCRYRVTVKSSAKQRGVESWIDYVARMVELIKSYDITIPKDEMCPVETYNRHMEDFERGVNILDEVRVPRKNFAYCDAYFRSCEYFSRCHGSIVSEAYKNLDVTIEE